MKLDELGEFALIERITAGALLRKEPGTVGIGDDCAVFRAAAGRDILLTTDMLVERVHFRRETTTPVQLGRKSISVNLSDIAACGGTPREAVISMAIPRDIDVEFAELLFRGMRERAHEFGVNILGGDTTTSRRDMVINVALTGEVESGRAVLRSGAREGDLIFLTGPVGDAAAGLDVIVNQKELVRDFTDLVRAFHDPRPQVVEGETIGKSGWATAMIDVSDGVAADLNHISRASGFGARIYADRIPKSTSFREYAARVELDVQQFAVSGGEDYVLLFTVNPRNQMAMANLLAEECRLPIHNIGVMTRGPGMEFVKPDGKIESLSPRGWDHFLKQSDHP
jgi:thiamine-monophosphate kinase